MFASSTPNDLPDSGARADDDTQQGSASPLVLVVDDDPVMRSVLAKQLTAGGYRVLTAAEGMEALAIFEEENADLVILDVKMPGMDGFEVCEALKRAVDVPVIFVTGAQDGIICNHMSKMVDTVGAECYLRKPFDSKSLLMLVGEVLEKASH